MILRLKSSTDTTLPMRKWRSADERAAEIDLRYMAGLTRPLYLRHPNRHRRTRLIRWPWRFSRMELPR